MDIESVRIRITDHAYERYCQRVGRIDRHELEMLVRGHLMDGHRVVRGYLHTGGIWWRASWENGILTLYTCYGRSHLDLPAAVRWAKRYRDRIALGD